MLLHLEKIIIDISGSCERCKEDSQKDLRPDPKRGVQQDPATDHKGGAKESWEKGLHKHKGHQLVWGGGLILSSAPFLHSTCRRLRSSCELKLRSSCKLRLWSSFTQCPSEELTAQSTTEATVRVGSGRQLGHGAWLTTHRSCFKNSLATDELVLR